MGVLLALLVGVVGFFAVPASPALADEHPQLEVRINAVSPALIDPTDEGQLVTITGTVTNTSARDMRYVNVHFWRSRQPLTGLDEINDAVSAPLSSPLGSRLDSLESGNLDLLAAEDPFPPGETANFTVQATVAQLELPTVSDAVYRLGVHVRAIPNGDSNTTVGRARVLVPASPLDLPVSATVLLSSRPVAHADGDPINQQESARLLSELTGRLETLLAAAERPNVVGIIDPETLPHRRNPGRGQRRGPTERGRPALAAARRSPGRREQALEAPGGRSSSGTRRCRRPTGSGSLRYRRRGFERDSPRRGSGGDGLRRPG